MITRTQLRIGSKVLLGNDIVTVKEIGAFEASFQERNFVFPYATIEPVPLSPEILQACGVEKGLYKGMDQWLGPWFERVQPLTRNRIGIIYNGTIGYYYNASVVNVVLTNLHQLQNLYFALTGSELTVNLEQIKV